MDAHRLERLCQASVTKSYIPEKDVSWGAPFGPSAMALPSPMLSLAGEGRGPALTPEQCDRLARHELASMLSGFVRFESVINGYLARVAESGAAEDRELTYLFHIVEEEARHSRMFAHCIGELGTGTYPRRGPLGLAEWLVARLVVRRRSLFYLTTLCVEDVTDRILAQMLESESLHPGVSDLARIHRIEESRHMDFVRDALQDAYTRAGRLERALVRGVAPWLAFFIFEILLSSDVYLRSGIARTASEGRQLWWAGRRGPVRRALRRFSGERLRVWCERVGLSGPLSRRAWHAAGFGG